MYCFVPGYAQAAGSFGTIADHYRVGDSYKVILQKGFATIEDAGDWGWDNSIKKTSPHYFEGGIVYYKETNIVAPPALGPTNYRKGCYTDPPSPVICVLAYIFYYPDVPVLSKSFAPPPCNLSAGNPIHVGIGDKYQIDKDYTGTGGFDFIRYYHSSQFSPKGGFGRSWRHTYDRKISMLTSNAYSFAYITRADGKQFSYQLTAGIWISEADINDALIRLTDASGSVTGWQLTDGETGQVETYDTAGKLIAITERSGLTQTLTYSDLSTPGTIAPAPDLLIRVTDAFGRSLNFTYVGDSRNSRISTLTDPAGGVYRYAYDVNSNLTSVIYPDGSSKTYHYENAGLPRALTGITDENGSRFASYTYDAQGRATSSEHAGGAERVSLVYNGDGITTVTDALNTARTHRFQTVQGVVKSTGQSQPGGAGCAASSSTLSYDANGNIASLTDFNGNRTDYSYDLSRNLEISRTEGLTASGAATPATRTVTTAWHPTFRLPVRVTQANQETTYTYNSQGDITQKTLKDLATNTTRSWNTTYNYSAIPGVLLQKVEDGPRTDIADLTTHDYYPADAACAGGHWGCRGQLLQITDALGHATRFTRYSPHGQLEERVDPNGLVTTTAYDARQRLISMDVGGETTTFAYDPAGQVTRTTRPDGTYLAYSYDAAHRLVKTQDDQGNTLVYTLDAMGNRIKEDLFDPGGQLVRTQSRVYDALSRLQSIVLPQ